MSRMVFGFLLFVSLTGAAAEAPRAEAEQAKPEKVEELINDLGSENFQAREQATAELKKRGKPAVPLLERALAETKDLEVKWRAEAILDEIAASSGELIDYRGDEALKKKLEGAKLASPQAFLQWPLQTALQQFSQQTQVEVSQELPGSMAVNVFREGIRMEVVEAGGVPEGKSAAEVLQELLKANRLKAYAERGKLILRPARLKGKEPEKSGANPEGGAVLF